MPNSAPKQLEILSLASTGKGCGFIEDSGLKTPYFVAYTCPKDIIEIKNEKKTKKYVEAEIKEIIKQSNFRSKETCKHFTVCGGCNLLHISYKKQIEEKEKILLQILDRNKIEHSKIKIIDAKQKNNYRYKSKIFSSSDNTHSYLGFKKERTNDVVKINECRIVHEKITDFIKKFNDAKLEKSKEFEVKAIVDFDTEKLSIKINEKLSENIEKWIKENCDYFNEDIDFSYNIGNTKLSYNNKSFIQSNLKQNFFLVRTILENIDSKNGFAFDLYGGIGNFAISISKKARQIFCVEHNTHSFYMMLKNISQNNIKNIQCHNESVEDFLKKIAVRPECIILDPPRTGCGQEVIEKVKKISPNQIIYVSCDPITLKDELKLLISDYKIKKIFLVDMFPHTEHIETVSILEKK